MALNIFYNPKTKKPYPWVMIIFVIVPIVVIIVVISISNHIAKSNQEKQSEEKKVDIFEKI